MDENSFLSCFSVAEIYNHVFVPSYLLFNVQEPCSHNSHGTMLLHVAVQSSLQCNHLHSTSCPSLFSVKVCIVIVDIIIIVINLTFLKNRYRTSTTWHATNMPHCVVNDIHSQAMLLCCKHQRTMLKLCLKNELKVSCAVCEGAHVLCVFGGSGCVCVVCA